MEVAIGLHGFSADLSDRHVVAALYSRVKGEGVWTSMVPVFTESGPSTNEYVVKVIKHRSSLHARTNRCAESTAALKEPP